MEKGKSNTWPYYNIDQKLRPKYTFWISISMELISKNWIYKNFYAKFRNIIAFIKIIPLCINYNICFVKISLSNFRQFGIFSNQLMLSNLGAIFSIMAEMHRKDMWFFFWIVLLTLIKFVVILKNGENQTCIFSFFQNTTMIWIIYNTSLLAIYLMDYKVFLI